MKQLRARTGVLPQETLQQEGGHLLAALYLDRGSLISPSAEDVRVVVKDRLDGVGVPGPARERLVEAVETASRDEILPALLESAQLRRRVVGDDGVDELLLGIRQ